MSGSRYKIKMPLRACYLIILLLFSAREVRATHVMGGNVEIRAVGNTPGNYKISLKLYIDLTSNIQAEAVEKLEIRKTDGDLLINTYELNQASSKIVIYENETCTETRKLKTQLVYYERDITLDPLQHADPNGYYLLWSSCCRNAGIVNIINPALTELNFKTSFPPLIKSGKPFLDSSPSFSELDGAYMCIGEPFYFSFDAVDPDGDELRYTMQAPLGRLGASSGYIKWANGYSATNAIPGSPALNIDAKTGELYVVPNQLGLFIFSVRVEEFRNGELIGSVSRDYQLNVVDCPPMVLEEPKILIGGKSIQEISVCEGETVLLSAVATSNDWNYQWKKDGKNLDGANAPSLQVTESGEFLLVTSLASTCSKSARSNVVKVNVIKSAFALSPVGPLSICKNGGSLQIEAPAGNNYIYHWFGNGNAIEGSAASLTVTAPGTYWATIEEPDAGCVSASDTVEISRPENVTVTLSAVEPMCGTDHNPVALTANPAGGIFSGAGIKGNFFDPKEAGIGVHEVHYIVSTSGSCPADTAKQLITVWDLPVANAGNDTGVLKGTSASIGGAEVAGLHYNWTPPDGLDDATSSRPLVTPLKNTSYTLQVTDSNGCTSSATVKVSIMNKVLLPDAFSPNGDGKNEAWQITGIESYPEAEVTVYNRWGEVVFFSRGYHTAFDGKIKGVLQPAGMYVYTIKLDASSSVLKGALTLFR